MTSVEKLLTNTTNRLSENKNIIISRSQSSFTPFLPTQQNYTLIQSKNISIHNVNLLQYIPQTYQQLELKYNQLNKLLKQAKHEKQLMAMLFQKVFLMEEGKQERMNKRFRRKKTQIQGKYTCKLCSKVYSSSTSLARHGKLKHSYSQFEPPQHDYQIPPQPNSIVELSDVQKRDETNANPSHIVQQFDNSSDSEEFGNSLPECSEGEKIEQEALFIKGLS